MHRRPHLSLFAVAVAFAPWSVAAAQSGDPGKTPESAANEPAASTFAERLAQYRPLAGDVKVGSVATAHLGEGWLWLDRPNGLRFLQDLGNQPGSDVLGIALPPDAGDSGVFAVYSYADEGHIADDEAPDYDELLREMKDDAPEESKARREHGLPGFAVLGWAEPPHYDRDQHKLYWAVRLRFDGQDDETLNYNVRVLGRTGHLVVNGVGDVAQLQAVAACSKSLLTATEFVQGKRYEDFNPSMDKIAAYGIGGLIAGKLALKAGLFAKLLLLAKGFIKPLIAGVVILGGLLWKVLGGKKRERPEDRPTAAGGT